jgi:hypothetical protein
MTVLAAVVRGKEGGWVVGIACEVSETQPTRREFDSS